MSSMDFSLSLQDSFVETIYSNLTDLDNRLTIETELKGNRVFETSNERNRMFNRPFDIPKISEIKHDHI